MGPTEECGDKSQMRYRGTEVQRFRGSEVQRFRGSEVQRFRGSEVGGVGIEGSLDERKLSGLL